MVVAVAEVGPSRPAVLDATRVQVPERVDEAMPVGEGSVEVVLEWHELLAMLGLVTGFEHVQVTQQQYWDAGLGGLQRGVEALDPALFALGLVQRRVT